MNNRNKRATRAIVASGSLLAIIFIAVPWVDEYLRLRSDAQELRDLQAKYAKVAERKALLDDIEDKTKQQLEAWLPRSVDPEKVESVRETLVELVRRANGKVRRLDIVGADQRPWATEHDDPRRDTMPFEGEESRFALHTHEIEIQVDGSLETIRQVLAGIIDQGWFMTTRRLTMVPSGMPESPMRLEFRFVLYGLGASNDEQTLAYQPRLEHGKTSEASTRINQV